MSRDVARGRKQGIMSVLVDEAWIHITRGSFILVLGGVTHDFENRSDTRAGVLNLSIPGSFERHMPDIAQWFAENPPKDAGIYRRVSTLKTTKSFSLRATRLLGSGSSSCSR